MPNFCCKNCGMITDKPTIVPHLDKIGYYQELREELDKHKPAGAYSRILYDYKEIEYSQKYNYSITCPVCLNETRFWRDEPFPTDKNNNIDLSSIPTRVI